MEQFNKRIDVGVVLLLHLRCVTNADQIRAHQMGAESGLQPARTFPGLQGCKNPRIPCLPGRRVRSVGSQAVALKRLLAEPGRPSRRGAVPAESVSRPPRVSSPERPWTGPGRGAAAMGSARREIRDETWQKVVHLLVYLVISAPTWSQDDVLPEPGIRQPQVAVGRPHW